MAYDASWSRSSSSQFLLTFRCTLSSIGFFAGLSNGPDIGKRTRDNVAMTDTVDEENGRFWRRQRRGSQQQGVGERIGDRVPVFAF